MSLMKCIKRPYTVSVRKPKLGTAVNDFLHHTDSVTTQNEPYIITGTIGEEWCISASKLLSSYDLTQEQLDHVNYKPVEIKTRTDANAPTVLVSRVPIEEGPFLVHSDGRDYTGNQPGIDHGPGDVIVMQGDSKWVVNGLVFLNTYKVLEEIE